MSAPHIYALSLAVVALSIVVACRERPPATWSGIDRARATCTYGEDRLHVDCVLDRVVYLCVQDAWGNSYHWECGPVFNLPERP